VGVGVDVDWVVPVRALLLRAEVGADGVGISVGAEELLGGSGLW